MATQQPTCRRTAQTRGLRIAEILGFKTAVYRAAICGTVSREHIWGWLVALVVAFTTTWFLWRARGPAEAVIELAAIGVGALAGLGVVILRFLVNLWIAPVQVHEKALAEQVEKYRVVESERDAFLKSLKEKAGLRFTFLQIGVAQIADHDSRGNIIIGGAHITIQGQVTNGGEPNAITNWGLTLTVPGRQPVACRPEMLSERHRYVQDNSALVYSYDPEDALYEKMLKTMGRGVERGFLTFECPELRQHEIPYGTLLTLTFVDIYNNVYTVEEPWAGKRIGPGRFPGTKGPIRREGEHPPPPLPPLGG